jgi:hypothetical protein
MRIDEAFAKRYAFRLERSENYIKWRYWDNPMCTFEMASVRDADGSGALAVFRREAERAIITDFIGEPSETAISQLIGGLCEILRKCGVCSLSIEVIETSPLLGTLRSLGFVRRDTSPLYALRSVESQWTPAALDGWHVTEGDRDL